MRVEERREGRVAVRFREHYLTVSLCPVPPRAAPEAKVADFPKPAKGKRDSLWAKGFALKKSPPLWRILRQEQGAAAPVGRER